MRRPGRTGRPATTPTVLEAVEEREVPVAAQELFAFLDTDSAPPTDGVRVVQRWVLTGAADRHDELQVELLDQLGRRPWLSAVVVEEVDPPRRARWRGLGEQDVTMELVLEPVGARTTRARLSTTVVLPAGTTGSALRGTRAWLDDPTYLAEAVARLSAPGVEAPAPPPVTSGMLGLPPEEHRFEVALDADRVWDVLGDLAAVPTPHGLPQRVMSLVGERRRPAVGDLAAAAVADATGRRQLLGMWVDRVEPGSRLVVTSTSETFDLTVDLLLEAHRSADGTDSTVVRTSTRLRVVHGLEDVEVRALTHLTHQHVVQHLAEVETRLRR